jgi:hypothetical protein
LLLTAWFAVVEPGARAAPVDKVPSAPPAVIAADMAVEAGIYEVTEATAPAVHDFNVDGWPDFLLPRYAEAPARLYLNDGSGHFTEVAEGTFAQSDRDHCTAADVDVDGLPDIFCSVGAYSGIAVKANELWMQGPETTFGDRAAEWTALDPYGRGREASFINANGDGYPDLFLGNDPFRFDAMPSRNHLLVNVDGAAFRYAPELGVDLDVGAKCVDVGDFDADGWEDLLVCAELTGVRLYHNEGGTGFVDVSASMGIPQSRETKGAIFVDLNGDGSLDLVQVLKRQVEILIQQSDGFQSLFTRDLESGAEVAAGDANGDGAQDLYVVQSGTPNAPDVMLINDGTGTGFTEMSIPQATEGEGNAAVPIDHDGSGTTDFLVVNGRHDPGPVQLIAFFPELRPRDGFRDGWYPVRQGGARPLEPTAPAVPEAWGQMNTLTERWEAGAWGVVPSPNMGGRTNSLRAAAALDTGEVWSVGFYVKGGGNKTLAERWDGLQWSLVPTPTLGNNNYLFGVAGLSPSDLWAVGSERIAGVYRPLTERWDGSSWTVVPTPQGGPESDFLHAVASLSSNDVWAVGRSSENGIFRTLAEHWDGDAWSVADSPNVGAGANALLGVWGQSSGPAWAVGYSHDGTAYRTLALRRNGQRWKVVATPNVGTGDNVLVAVSGASRKDVWAVGYHVVGGDFRTLTLHWNGLDWTAFSSPNAGQGASVLRAVTVVDPADAWAVGTSYDPVSSDFHTLILHWDGLAWSAVESGDVAGHEDELLGVTASPNDVVWGVGASYRIALDQIPQDQG